MVQDLAKQIIGKAVEVNAQDIYLIPKEGSYELYMRIGDERRFCDVFEFDRLASLISHFKFVAGMNVGEKRRSQLGSCDYSYTQGEEVSLRLSTVGDYRGYESLVIRLLYSGKQELRFWFEEDLKKLVTAVNERGLYLFSGPVGSGKTTLMYELVKQRYPDKQIITIEDPVEIKQDHMLQLQLNESIDMTYDSLIKLSLRHRPDVLIIGEIRDAKTAHAVIRASLTGATVFSTIHAKSIPGVYARLLELGISEKELENSLRGVAYQRLVGGGGVIDFVQNQFQDHSAEEWNRKINSLFAEGHLTWEQAQSEKISD
ncbi:competence type IV pilus ATPase ComGA [Streptococcus saliviloxodontae]|uniref:Competence protein ComGA n=1 Tax=Streptococcus saliviloxodontae TaxID=1349416 RepID=A0ABS2PP42_9STRE|nr:competence type IV pilus ATPase ComGA [Streptococcus saliviloxodontae]MBM7636726.1 competence protein ComGA [Streptococcus saliviloxodontae]